MSGHGQDVKSDLINYYTILIIIRDKGRQHISAGLMHPVLFESAQQYKCLYNLD